MPDFASANSKTNPSEEKLRDDAVSNSGQSLFKSKSQLQDSKLQDSTPRNESTKAQTTEAQMTETQIAKEHSEKKSSPIHQEAEDKPSTHKELLPTVGQLMRQTSQDMLRLYKERLGKRPSKVSCDLVSEKLVIWIENSITPLERLLFESGDSKAISLCSAVDDIMHQHIVEVIERHLKVKVETLISDTSYEQECTGIIAKLSTRPVVRASRRLH